MDLLKLLTRRGGSISRVYFLSGRKLFHTRAAAVTNGLLSKCGYHSQQSVSSRRSPLQVQASAASSIKGPSMFPERRLRFYSTDDAKQDKDKTEEASSSTSSSAEEPEATEERNSGESVEKETESFSSSGDNLSAKGTSETSPSKSQTGEPLPSEQDQSDWDSKIDKLYKQIELEVLAYEPSVLDSYQWFVLTAASHLGIKVGKCWAPQHHNSLKFPLLKSAFVHKKHVVHYEVRTHHRFLTFHKLTSSTADTFLEYIERNLPEGVGLKVTRVEAKALPHYLRPPQQQKEQPNPAQLT